MAAMPSIRWTFSIPYRGGSHITSTRMHFSGGVPADDAAWHLLWSHMWTDFRLGIAEEVTLETITGYANDTSPSVFTEAGLTSGSFDRSVGEAQAAIVCALLSWTTDQRNSRGGPIFLRNFIHCVMSESFGDLDQLASSQQDALGAFASKFDAAGAGYSDGTNTYHRAGPNGAVGLVGTAESNLSRRVLARRG